MQEIRKNKYIRRGTPKEPTKFDDMWFRDSSQLRADLNFWLGYLRNNQVGDDLRSKIASEIRYLTYAENVIQAWSRVSKHNSAFIRQYYNFSSKGQGWN